jgi:xanthine dehydrogenase iron-sulfur cluster and FAD-binding subunit A
MLMRAVEILQHNPDPTIEQVREEIASNLCRCTGYQFICEAVVAAAPRLRGEPAWDPTVPTEEKKAAEKKAEAQA